MQLVEGQAVEQVPVLQQQCEGHYLLLFRFRAFFKELRWFPHNIWAIMAEIKLPKHPLSTVISWIKVRRSYGDLSSQADPTKENWTWSYPYVSWKGCFMLVENTVTLAFSILTKFDIKFLECLGFSSRGRLENWITITGRCFKDRKSVV